MTTYTLILLFISQVIVGLKLAENMNSLCSTILWVGLAVLFQPAYAFILAQA